jgi:hypothetical protein
MSLDQALIAQALRPKPTTALPAAVAMVQAQAVIKRAHDSAPMFTEIDPPIGQGLGRDSLPPPPPVPAGKDTPENSGVVETPTAEPAPKTGLHGRPIITLKKSRKVKS